MTCDYCGKGIDYCWEDLDYIKCHDCNYNICNDCIEKKHNVFKNNIRQVQCGKCFKVLKNYYGYVTTHFVNESYNITREITLTNVYEILGCDVEELVLKLAGDNHNSFKYCRYGGMTLYSDTPPQCSKHSNNSNYCCTEKCYNFCNEHDILDDYNYIKKIKQMNKDIKNNNNKLKIEYLHENDFDKIKMENIKTLKDELEKLERKKRIKNTPDIDQQIKETKEEIDKQKRSKYLNKRFRDFIFDPCEVKKKEEYKCGGFDGDDERMVF